MWGFMLILTLALGLITVPSAQAATITPTDYDLGGAFVQGGVFKPNPADPVHSSIFEGFDVVSGMMIPVAELTVSVWESLDHTFTYELLLNPVYYETETREISEFKTTLGVPGLISAGYSFDDSLAATGVAQGFDITQQGTDGALLWSIADGASWPQTDMVPDPIRFMYQSTFGPGDPFWYSLTNSHFGFTTNYGATVPPNPVPEPTTILFVSTGLVMMGAGVRRRMKK